MSAMTITCDVCGAERPSYREVASGYVTCLRCRRKGKGTGAIVPDTIAEQIANSLEGVTTEPFGEAARALRTAEHPVIPIRRRDRH